MNEKELQETSEAIQKVAENVSKLRREQLKKIAAFFLELKQEIETIPAGTEED